MSRLDAWESRTRTVLTVLALVFLVAYAAPIVAPDLPQPWRGLSETVQTLIWAVFVVDYGTRLLLAERRWQFVRSHPLDLAAVALPALRPLRLVAALVLLQQQAGHRLRGHVASYVAIATATVITISALAVLDAERGMPEATIESWQDSFWWAFVTVTTVGYGDHYPVTAEGRLFAVALMLCGIALLGIVTASLASWLLEKIADQEEQAQAATKRDMAVLLGELRELRAEVSALRQDRPG
jgi:voltage-gated potassium channel